jgi:excinuclease UvrABC nuclease subunit
VFLTSLCGGAGGKGTLESTTSVADASTSVVILISLAKEAFRSITVVIRQKYSAGIDNQVLQ